MKVLPALLLMALPYPGLVGQDLRQPNPNPATKAARNSPTLPAVKQDTLPSTRIRKPLPFTEPTKPATVNPSTERVAAESRVPTTPRVKPIVPAYKSREVPESVHDDRNAFNNDVLFIYNLCAGKKEPSLLALGLEHRKWNFLRATDNVRMLIEGINPERCTVTLNTLGLQNEFIVERSPLSILSVEPPTEAGIGGSDVDTIGKGSSPPNQFSVEQAVQANQHLIDNYIAALQDRRRQLTAGACLSLITLDAYLDGKVPGSDLSRSQLVSEQQRLLGQLDEANSLRQASEEGLARLQKEIDQWFGLRAGSIVRGPMMPARDKDFIRFEVKRRCGDGAEESLPVIDVPVYGNFRLNVSTGLLFHGLVDYHYLAIDEKVANPTPDPGSTSGNNSATTRKVPVKEDPPFLSGGVGALIHAYHTRPWAKGSLAPALSLGASLNTTGRYTVMLGPSLIIGGDQRLVVTTGVAFGPVARLQKPHQEGQAYEFSGAEFPTTQRTIGSWFVGITWNLSSRRNPVTSN